MSGVTVWFLLVFLPKLIFITIPFMVVSAIIIVISVAWMACSWEDIRGEETIEEWKKMGCWSKSEEVRQNGAVNGLRKGKQACKWAVISLVISSVLTAAIPNRKEVAAIVLIPYMSNNTEFLKIPENLAKKLNEYLTDQISPEKKDD